MNESKRQEKQTRMLVSLLRVAERWLSGLREHLATAHHHVQRILVVLDEDTAHVRAFPCAFATEGEV